MKNFFKPVTKTSKVSEDVTKTMTEKSKQNSKSLENMNNQFLEKTNGRGILATYLLSLLSEISNSESISQFKLIKDPDSTRVNDLLKKNFPSYQLLCETIC